jgi:hypothetical protein
MVPEIVESKAKRSIVIYGLFYFLNHAEHKSSSATVNHQVIQKQIIQEQPSIAIIQR